MASSKTVARLQFAGCYWFAVVLLSLIVSGAFEPVRHFVTSNSLLLYLVLYLVAVSPGFVMLYLAERMQG